MAGSVRLGSADRSLTGAVAKKNSGSRLQQMIPTELLPGLSSIQGCESRFETGLCMPIHEVDSDPFFVEQKV